jgi:hypothetical protein
MNPSSRKLPAVLHAVLQNNIDVVKFICEKSQREMSWMWHDDEKHNVVSYITGSVAGVSHENVTILEFVASQMKPEVFKKLLQMRSIHGKIVLSLLFNCINLIDSIFLYRHITRSLCLPKTKQGPLRDHDST